MDMLSPSYLPENHNQLPDLQGLQVLQCGGQAHLCGKSKTSKRVGSYFSKSVGINQKTRKMVREIRKIEITIVNSEFDALLLENNLIKKPNPNTISF